MAFYYVKSGGTAAAGTDAGRHATEQTGSFASLGAANYYNTCEDAFNALTIPAAGDRVCVSDIHSHSYAVSTTLSTINTDTNATLIISVDDVAIDSSKAGAYEEVTISNNDFHLSGALTIDGMSLKAVDDLNCGQLAGSSIIAHRCTFTASGDSDRVSLAGLDGGNEFIDCTFALNHTNSSLTGNNDSSSVKVFGGKVTTTTAGLIALSSGAGRENLYVGVDLTAVTGHLLNSGGTGTSFARTHTFKGCKLNAALTGVNISAQVQRKVRILLVNCSSDSAASEYQYHCEQYGGIVEDQDTSGIYRNESVAFPSGMQTSLKVTTDANCTLNDPIWFDAPTRYAALSATGTIRLYLSCSVALTDSEVWAEATYPDGTNKQLYNFASTRNANILAAGTTLTTDATSTWIDGGGTWADNAYQIDIDASGGADCAPSIRIYVAKPSTTIYFDTSVGVI